MENIKIKTPIFFECHCKSVEHFLKFSVDYDDERPDTSFFCVETYINDYNSFLKRIFIAVKYIFGFRMKNGDFDGFIFKDQDLENLEGLIKQFKKLKRKSNAKIN